MLSIVYRENGNNSILATNKIRISVSGAADISTANRQNKANIIENIKPNITNLI